MQELEKILEEIEQASYLNVPNEKSIPIRVVKDIICNRMTRNDGWIPVKEALPEEGMEVIVTDKEGRVWGTRIYGYPDETDTEMCFHEWDDEDWQCFKPDVIAWRPLPDPYCPERSEGE